MAFARFRQKELISDLSLGSQNLKVSVSAAETVLKYAQTDSFTKLNANPVTASSSGGSSSSNSSSSNSASNGSTEAEQLIAAMMGVIDNEREPSLCIPLLMGLSIVVKTNREICRFLLHIPRSVSVLLKAMRTFRSDTDTVSRIVAILHSFLQFEKKAILVLRLEGAIERFFELLAVPKIAHSQKIVHSVLETVAVMVKRNEHTAFFNTLHKYNAVGTVMDLVRMHLSATHSTTHAGSGATTAGSKLFHSAALVLERLIKHDKMLSAAMDSGVVGFSLQTLTHPKLDDKTVNSLIRILKAVVRHPIGLAVLTGQGGFDAIYPAVKRHFDKPLTVRLACSLLWLLQTRSFWSRLEELPAFNVDTCGFEVDVSAFDNPALPFDDSNTNNNAVTALNNAIDGTAAGSSSTLSTAMMMAAAAAATDRKTLANSLLNDHDSSTVVHPTNIRNVTAFNVLDFCPELWDPEREASRFGEYVHRHPRTSSAVVSFTL